MAVTISDIVGRLTEYNNNSTDNHPLIGTMEIHLVILEATEFTTA